ncbi:MAG: hypothetical protein HYU34_05305 [Candidatus Omnitrophica bacterium]|nr:hypothetical protein [Candidatus Omnitrophota bacterium]
MGSLKSIKIPGCSETLAEFLGIFLGDGNIRSDFQIAVSFNLKTEQLYADYVSWLIDSLFGLKASTRYRFNYGGGELVVNSRRLVEFLYSQGMTKGDKIKKGASLPRWVFDNEQTRNGAARGLFDTDGCVYKHSYLVRGAVYQYPKLAFTSYSRIIRKQFAELLTLSAFHPKEYGNRVCVYSQKEVLRYFQEIGTHNPAYQLRFERFCEDVELESLFYATA